MRPKTETFEQVFRQPLGATRLDRPEAGDEFEIFERVELVVQHRLVGEPGDDSLGLDGETAGVDSEDLDVAFVGRQKPRDQA